MRTGRTGSTVSTLRACGTCCSGRTSRTCGAVSTLDSGGACGTCGTGRTCSTGWARYGYKIKVGRCSGCTCRIVCISLIQCSVIEKQCSYGIRGAGYELGNRVKSRTDGSGGAGRTSGARCTLRTCRACGTSGNYEVKNGIRRCSGIGYLSVSSGCARCSCAYGNGGGSSGKAGNTGISFVSFWTYTAGAVITALVLRP